MSHWGMHLSPRARKQILLITTALVLSGVLWILLGWNLEAEDYTNPLRTWRHRLLILHGIAAYGLLWVTGRLYDLHQKGNWRARRNHHSGLGLSIVLLLLAASGLTLYYPPQEEWRDTLSVFHQMAGMSITLLLPLHIWLARKDRRARQALRGVRAHESIKVMRGHP